MIIINVRCALDIYLKLKRKKKDEEEKKNAWNFLFIEFKIGMFIYFICKGIARYYNKEKKKKNYIVGGNFSDSAGNSLNWIV